jgi:CheY-like chemotaxis protein
MLPEALTHRRILVVEDDADTLQLFVAYLTRLGAEVRAASTAVAALALLESWRPDVVLCDLHLPDVDGYALLARLRADPTLADLPVVAISGSHPSLERDRSLRAGFANHVAKPTRIQQILEALVAAIDASPATPPARP